MLGGSMSVDFFRLLKSRNRAAFAQTGRGGKTSQNRLKAKTLEVEQNLRKVLPSNYQSSITGPNYSIALRAYALEFAKIRIAIEDLSGDTYLSTEAYGSNRADLAYQKLGYLLSLDKNLSLSIFSSQEFSQFMLSLVGLFFGGATPANIVRGIEIFVGEAGVVKLTENFLDARNENSAYDISDQFGFVVDFELTDTISQNFTDIGVKLDFLINLIKPAHTLYQLRYIFKEFSDLVPDIDDDTKAENSWNHAYDDARKYCAGVKDRDRLGVKEVLEETEDLTGYAGDTLIVSKGPISKNTATPEYGGVADVIVLVDAVPVTVNSVEPLTGKIVLAVAILSTQTVSVNYFYWNGAQYTIQLNMAGDSLKFPNTMVLNQPNTVNPQQVTWSYEGFESDASATTNSLSFRLNQPTNKISDSNGKLYGYQHVLNRGNYVKSTDPAHILNEGTPLIETRISGDAEFEWNVGESDWVITTPAKHFNSGLTQSFTETGETGVLQVACGDILSELSIDNGLEETFTFTDVPFCDSGLFTFNMSDLNGTDALGDVEGCQVTQQIVETPPTDIFVTSDITDAPLHSLGASLEESRGDSYDTTGLFIFNTSELNGSDVLWDPEVLGHWSDEGWIVLTLGATVYHLPSKSKDIVVGLP